VTTPLVRRANYSTFLRRFSILLAVALIKFSLILFGIRDYTWWTKLVLCFKFSAYNFMVSLPKYEITAKFAQVTPATQVARM
jgi:hypothetical protein